MLRIMAGQLKGKRLAKLPKGHFIRPILARVKKSLFDILRPRLPNARFLDLYAGTGTVGLEALSRGAALVAFVEEDHHSIRFVKENVHALGLSEKGQVFRASALGDLSTLPKPFDIIFMGPPYVDRNKKLLALVSPTLVNIEQSRLLNPGGWVVAQHHKKEPVEPPTAEWTLFRQERYGDTMLSFFRKGT